MKGTVNNMDYKKLIIELLEKADDRKLKLIYCYIKALLGCDDRESNE